jgi:ABC-2 type transport system ATP-binding protein
MAVIEVRNLAKRYGEQVALDGVSFSVEEGEIFGILGPNGAGKTTAVECMAGLRRPDSGSIRVLGLDPQADGQALSERVGVQLQETHLQDKIKVWEALDLYASFYRRPADWNRLLETWGWRASATPWSASCPAARGSACSSRSPWSAGPTWCSGTS